MSTLSLNFLYRAERSLLGTLQAVHRAFDAHREQRAAVLALSKLDDHLLEDIGMTRPEMSWAAYDLPSEGKR